MSKKMLLIFLICSLGLLFGITRIVDIDGSEQYTTIQSAIDASASGDVVLVHPGRYVENVSISTNNLTLESLEAVTNNPAYIDSTIIDGNAIYTCFKVFSNTQDIEFRGFSLTNGFNNGNGGGIGISPNVTAIIQNCKIFNNIALGGGGIITAGSAVTLSGVKIYHNRCLAGGGGILITNSGSLVTFDPVNRCSIYNNIAGGSQDILVWRTRTDIDIYLDTFTVLNPSNYFAQNCNDYGYQNYMNLHILNAFTQEINHDLYVSPLGNDENDGLSPLSALKTIHTAIYRIAADSLNPKTVHILPGTFSLTANQQIFPITMKSWVNVVGAGMDSTIIIGEDHPQFSSIYVTDISTSYKSNYTLADVSLSFVDSMNGKLIGGTEGSRITFRNIKAENLTLYQADLISLDFLRDSVIDGLIIDNVTFNDGSVVNIYGEFSGMMKNWKITNCRSTAVYVSAWAHPLIWLKLSDTSIENCIFDHMAMADSHSQCIAFGGVDNPAQPITMNINNTLFSNINGENGIINFGAANNANINISNCDFVDNFGHDYNLQLYGIAHIQNSIFLNQTPYEIHVPVPDNGEHIDLTLDYNSIQNGQTGILNSSTANHVYYLNHNISSSPGFLGGDEYDPLRYSLAAGSLCIDSGTQDTTGLALPISDLAGNYRIWNNRIDMGCYEFGSIPVGNEDELPPEVGATILYNYPNPFNPSTTISFSIPKSSHVTLSVYNIRGQKVRQLINENMPLELHKIIWDGKDGDGKACASGVYFYRLNATDKCVTKKMLMLK